jgi:hypothetical protein
VTISGSAEIQVRHGTAAVTRDPDTERAVLSYTAGDGRLHRIYLGAMDRVEIIQKLGENPPPPRGQRL